MIENRGEKIFSKKVKINLVVKERVSTFATRNEKADSSLRDLVALK